MQEAIAYYQRKHRHANHKMKTVYICKLIKLGHQPTIDDVVADLENGKCSDRLILALAKLNRYDINESLVRFVQEYFPAGDNRWRTIGTIKDDRIVETIMQVISADNDAKYNSRYINILRRIGSHSSYLALRRIIETYFDTDIQFIDNAHTLLAHEALKALKHIDLPEAQAYRQQVEVRYQARIDDELASYPERLTHDATDDSVRNAIFRMGHYALPTLIQWHQSHPSEQVRDLTFSLLLLNLDQMRCENNDNRQKAIAYLLTCYDELVERDNLTDFLNIICYHDNLVIPFVWRAFDENLASENALEVFALHQAESVFAGVVRRFQHKEHLYLETQQQRQILGAYINYLGKLATPEAEALLIDLYALGFTWFQDNIVNALVNHAKKRESAHDFIIHIIASNPHHYTLKRTILSLGQVGQGSLLALLSLLNPNSDLTTYAVESLGRLANSSAIPYLIQLLLDIDPESELVTKVHETLEKIGTEASFATINAWDARYG